MIQTSEQIDAISAALVKAQAKIQNVGKTGTAKATNSFSYKYAELPEVLDEARGKLSAEGIYILQATVNGEGSNIGVITRLLHSSGQWIESALYVAPTKFDAQGVGSVSTYLRRYALMSMVGIGADDDDGAAATVAAPQQQRAGMVRAADVPAVAPQGPPDFVRRSAPAGHTRAAGDGNGSVLPVSPEEPPEMRLKRAAIRIAKGIQTAPNDHACDVLMDDARDDLAAIETVKEPIFEFKDGMVNGIDAAKRLRTRWNQRIAELRAGK